MSCTAKAKYCKEEHCEGKVMQGITLLRHRIGSLEQSCKGIELNGTAEKGKGLEQPCNGIAQTSGAMAKLTKSQNSWEQQ